jgi:hypothetical protein
VTALARSSTHIDLFIVDKSGDQFAGQVITAAWDSATGWSAWRSLSAKGINGTQVAAVSRRGGTHMDLLYVHIVVKNLQWDSASGWTLPFDAAGD